MKVLAIRHIVRENAGTIEHFLRDHAVQLDYWDIPVQPERKISISEYAAVISLGGPMGVYEEEHHPFIRREIGFLQELVRVRKPVLGVCLGSQMLAKALGANVMKGTQKEIGWYDVSLTPDARKDRVFGKLSGGWPVPFQSSRHRLVQNGTASRDYPENRNRLRVFHWHGDTFDLPRGAVRLAYSSLYQNQAFRYDNFAYGLQFHVEMTESMIREWVAAGRKELAGVSSYINPAAILKETPVYLSRLQECARQFCQEFFSCAGAIKNEK